MSEEEMEIWRRFNHFQWEIDLCLNEQYPIDYNPTDEELLVRLNTFGELTKEWMEDS